MSAVRRLSRLLPEPVRKFAVLNVGRANRSLPGLRVDWGDIARRAPFSQVYGWDRGLPVDRHYIEQFMRANEGLIAGDVLEVRSALYSEKYGSASTRTVVDVDEGNRAANLHADLNVAGSIGENRFDCVILTQVLQYTDPQAALRTVKLALRPGGTALITVPCVGRIDPEAPDVDQWRWTPRGFAVTLDRAGLTGEVQGFGNSLAAAALLLGIAAEEVPEPRLTDQDAAFPVVACVVAR
jgi:SAM-dependent methyltransferase